jgi:hypothetical protein
MYQQQGKVGSYVIFTTDSDDVMTQMDSLVNSTSWNNRAHFLVVVTAHMDSPDLLALSIVQQLWDSTSVLNALVLVENETVFQLYTWFPYQSYKDCGAVSNVQLIKVLNKNGNNNNKIIFPYKVPKDFLGCPIKVSISYIDHNIGATLLTTFLLRLNFTVLHQRNFSENDDTVDRIRTTLQDFIFDFCDIAGSYGPQASVLEYGDPSYEIDIFYYAWYVPCATPLDRIQKIATIFSIPLWMALMSVTVFVSVIMWQLARSSLEDDSYKNIFIVFYNVLAVNMSVSVSKMPRTSRLRIIFSAWVFHCLAISTVFQIFFTSFLANLGLQKQITNLDELVESKMEYASSPALRTFNNGMNEINKIINRGRECDDLEACLQRIIDTRNFALFEASRSVKQYLSSAKKRNYVCVMNNIDVISVSATALFSRRIFILDQFNKFVTRIFESGIRNKANKEIWITSPDLVDDEEYFVFSISHLLVAFYALTLGHSLGFVVFLLELLHHAYSTHHPQCSMIA